MCIRPSSVLRFSKMFLSVLLRTRMVTWLDVPGEILVSSSLTSSPSGISLSSLGSNIIGIPSGTGQRWIRHLTFVASPFGSITSLFPTLTAVVPVSCDLVWMRLTRAPTLVWWTEGNDCWTMVFATWKFPL